jgi:hypothetical protein
MLPWEGSILNQPRNEKDGKREPQAELDGSEPFFNLPVLSFNYSDMSSRWDALDVGAQSSNVISNNIHRSFSIEDKGLDFEALCAVLMNLVGHSLSQCCSTFPCLQVGSDGQSEGLRDAYQEWGFVDEQEIRMENLVDFGTSS